MVLSYRVPTPPPPFPRAMSWTGGNANYFLSLFLSRRRVFPNHLSCRLDDFPFAYDECAISLCLYNIRSWETVSPSAAASAARVARYANARTQMTSAFPPIKRLTLERKSPVTRLDINAPDFTAYKKTYPGLFK
jgi:hypothetical protein